MATDSVHHTNHSDLERSLLPNSSNIPRFICDFAPMMKRRYLYASCASLAVISLFGLLFTMWAEQPTINPTIHESPKVNSSVLPVIDTLGPDNNLIGAPTSEFRGLFNILLIVISFAH